MDRYEAYYNIKQFGYGPELQKKFGKPYSSVSNAELIPAVEELMFGKSGSTKVNNKKTPVVDKVNNKKTPVADAKQEDPKPKKLSADERIKLGREYANQINSLKARKAYMEKELELITTRDDLSIRISRGGDVSLWHIRSDGKIEMIYSDYGKYPDNVTTMYYYSKNTSYGNSSGVDVPLSEYVSNEDNVKLIRDEYISLYKESISDIDNLIKELEIKFAEL